MSRRPVVVALCALLTACSGSSHPATPSASVTSAPTTTTTSAASVEEQVRAAYLHSWDVYADAVRRLDASQLPEAFADPHLDAIKTKIADLQRRGRAVAVSVEHHVKVRVIDASTAIVADDENNHSVEIDQATAAPAEPDPNNVLRDNFTLKLIEGTWKVTVVIRQD